MKPKNIYLLYSCDIHKMHSSMCLVMASTSESKIRREIKSQIKDGNMRYGANVEDLKLADLNYLNSCLDFGYIEIVVDGERQ